MIPPSIRGAAAREDAAVHTPYASEPTKRLRFIIPVSLHHILLRSFRSTTCRSNWVWPRGAVLNGVLLAAIIELFTIPAFGWLSDRSGRKPMFIAGCLFSIAFAFPMFWLFQTHNPVVIAITIAVAVSFGQGIMFGPEAAWVAELFPARFGIAAKIVRRKPLDTCFSGVLPDHVPDGFLRQSIAPTLSRSCSRAERACRR